MDIEEKQIIEDNTKKLASMESLKNCSWWKIICEQIEMREKEKIEKILNNSWNDFEKRYSVNDIHKEAIDHLRWIVEIPERMIESLKS